MSEEVIFEFEGDQSRDDIAEYLRSVADGLEAGDPITLEAGEDAVTLDVPARTEFEVKAEREGPADGAGELSVEFELEWPEDATDGDEPEGLSIG